MQRVLASHAAEHCGLDGQKQLRRPLYLVVQANRLIKGGDKS